MEAKVAGATSAGRSPRSDQDRGKDCSATNPVDATDTSDHCGDDDQARRVERPNVSCHPAFDQPGATLQGESRTQAITMSKLVSPGSSSTRMTEPTTTPGKVPRTRRRVSRPPV